MATTITMDDDVQQILGQCRITEDRIYLPQVQLERDLYVKVDKILKAVGGKWNRSLQCHVFARDPRPFLLPGLETGTVTHLQQSLQSFYSPPAVAKQVIALANLDSSDLVLEPSVGMGALATEAATIVPKDQIWCVDTDSVACQTLRAAGFSQVLTGDFLAMTVFPSFQGIVMNPPFANGQDMIHIQHAHQFLAPGGRLVSVVPAMTGHKTRKTAAKRFCAFLDRYLTARIELPEGSFSASGTKVATSILVLRA